MINIELLNESKVSSKLRSRDLYGVHSKISQYSKLMTKIHTQVIQSIRSGLDSDKSISESYSQCSRIYSELLNLASELDNTEDVLNNLSDIESLGKDLLSWIDTTEQLIKSRNEWR